MIGRIGRLLTTVGVHAVEVVADVTALAVDGAEALLVTGHRRTTSERYGA